MNFLTKGYRVIAEHIRSEIKMYVWIVILLGGLLGWMHTEFVSTSMGEVMMTKTQAAIKENADSRQAADEALTKQVMVLAKEVKTSNELLMLHIDKERFNSVTDDIKNVEAEIFNIEQFVSVNGNNEQATNRLRALEAEHEDLILRRNCIINNNPMCD